MEADSAGSARTEPERAGAWLRGPKNSPKVPVIHEATSGGPNPKLMLIFKKLAPPPLSCPFNNNSNNPIFLNTLHFVLVSQSLLLYHTRAITFQFR